MLIGKFFGSYSEKIKKFYRLNIYKTKKQMIFMIISHPSFDNSRLS